MLFLLLRLCVHWQQFRLDRIWIQWDYTRAIVIKKANIHNGMVLIHIHIRMCAAFDLVSGLQTVRHGCLSSSDLDTPNHLGIVKHFWMNLWAYQATHDKIMHDQCQYMQHSVNRFTIRSLVGVSLRYGGAHLLRFYFRVCVYDNDIKFSSSNSSYGIRHRWLGRTNGRTNGKRE